MVNEKLGLEKFVESISFDGRFIKRAEDSELKESLSKLPSNRLTESVKIEEGNTDAYWVPVSRYGIENANGRIYPRELWEKVIREQRDIWQGSTMLTDHPEDDGNPADIAAVWLDAKMDPPSIKEGFVYGLLVPVGPNGQLLSEVAKAHGKIGTSSVGFGKLMNDGCTVDPDTFQIERLADWVLNPSQGTFFSYDENVEGKIRNSSIQESINDTITPLKENTVKDSKVAKLEEKRFRRDMESFLEDAAAIKDPQERLSEFKTIRSYLEDGACPDLREKIEEKIAAEEEYIKNALKEKEEFKEKFDIENTKDLEIKLTKIVEQSNSLNKEMKDWKGVAEKLQEMLNETKDELNNRPTNRYVEYLKNKISSLETEMDSYKEKFYDTTKKVVCEAKEVKSKERDLRKDLISTQQALNKSNQALKENFKKASKVATLERRIEKLQAALNESKKENEKLEKIVDNQRQKIEESTSKNLKLTKLVEKQKAQIQQIAKQTKDAQFRLYSEATSKKPNTKVENTSPIVAFYNDIYKEYGNAVVPFKESILRSMTLTQAKQTFYTQVLPNINESLEIERTRVPNTFGESDEKRANRIGMKLDESSAVTNLLDKYKGWI